MPTAKRSAAKKSSARAGAKETRAKVTSEDTPQSELVPPTRQTAAGTTATGQALASEDEEIPQGEDRGSKVEIVGDPQPDFAGPPGQPTGDQALPAVFTSNGQIPNRTVGSTAGPIPASVAGATQEDADRLAEETRAAALERAGATRGLQNKPLDERTIARLGRAELRAIAEARGYELRETLGTRGTRAAFLKAQDEDEDLQREDDEDEE